MKYVTLLLLFACNEPSKPPPQPPPPSARTEACTAALQTFDKLVDTGEPDARAKVKASIVERCVADGWSDEALACMRAAGTSHDTFRCWHDRLTQAQRDAVSSAFAKLSP